MVDDDPLLCDLVKRTLGHVGYAVECVHSVNHALEYIAHTPPDLVLLDLKLGADSGLRLIDELDTRGLNLPIAILTGGPSLSSAMESVRYESVVDYIVKADTDLVETVNRIFQTKITPKDSLAQAEAALIRFRQLLSDANGDPPADDPESAPHSCSEWTCKICHPDLSELSSRQREILKELHTGASNKEIAARLFISTQTVKNHLRAVFTKLDVHSRSEAMALLAGTTHNT